VEIVPSASAMERGKMRILRNIPLSDLPLLEEVSRLAGTYVGEREISEALFEQRVKLEVPKTREELFSLIPPLVESMEKEFIVIDVETQGLNGPLLMVGLFPYPPLGQEKFPMIFIPTKRMGSPVSLFAERVDIEKQDMREFLKEILPLYPLVVGHNLRYDLFVLAKEGILNPLREVGEIFCTYTFLRLYYGERGGFSLKKQTRRWGLCVEQYPERFGEDYTQLPPLEELAKYCSCDMLGTCLLFQHLRLFPTEQSFRKLFHRMEMEIVKVTASMQSRGIRLSPARIKKHRERMEEELRELHTRMKEVAGKEFNPNSPQQVATILWKELKLAPPQEMDMFQTSTSTSRVILERLRGRHPLVDLLLEYRETMKLMAAFISPLSEVCETEGAEEPTVYPSFDPMGTVVGRFSSSSPNLQNVPEQLRDVFIPRKGKVFIIADYDQIELRLFAHISQDPILLKAYREGEDLHRLTASILFSTPMEKVDDSQRRLGKMVNFAVLYGASSQGLAARLGIKRREAEKFLQQYFEFYKGVSEWRAKTYAWAEKHREVFDIFGRRRSLDKEFQRDSRGAFRRAVHFIVCSSAAGLMKLAMISLAREDIPILINVHDELVMEVNKEQVEDYLPKIRAIMEGVVKLRIPIVVDIRKAPLWVKKIEEEEVFLEDEG